MWSVIGMGIVVRGGRRVLCQALDVDEAPVAVPLHAPHDDGQVADTIGVLQPNEETIDVHRALLSRHVGVLLVVKAVT